MQTRTLTQAHSRMHHTHRFRLRHPFWCYRQTEEVQAMPQSIPHAPGVTTPLTAAVVWPLTSGLALWIFCLGRGG